LANIIKIKRGITAGFEPTGLTLGELAANLGDGKLFIGGVAGNSIQIVGSGGGGGGSVPLATNSVTGVASFTGNDFYVSPLGMVSLTGGLVRSVNGQTGDVTITGLPTVIPQATSSITGVASFNSTYFTVSGLGAVSLASAYQVTGDTIVAGTNVSIIRSGNSVTVSSSSGGGGSVPIATDSITGVASFTGNDFSVSALGSVSLTGGLVRSFNGATGAVSYSPVIATTSVTGVASFNSSYFSVDGFGAVSLASGYQVTGDTVVAGNRIAVSRSGNQATIENAIPIAASDVTGVASFDEAYFSVNGVGAVALQPAYQVTGDTVFAGTAISLSRSGKTVTLSNIGVTSFNGATGAISYAPPYATTSVTGVASFNSSYFSVSSGEVSLASAYQATGDTVVAGNRIVVTRSGRTVTIENGVPTAGYFDKGGPTGVANFNSGHFTVSATGNVSLRSIIFNTTAPPNDPLPYTQPPTLMMMPDSVSTNRFNSLSEPSGTADVLSSTIGKRVATTSTTEVILVKGLETNESDFNFTDTPGITATIVSNVYYHAADITVFAYSADQTSFSMRKFMVLGNQNGVGAKYSEYSNISTGSNLGTFSVGETAGYWALTVTPTSSSQTYFDVNAIRYRGIQTIV